MIKTKQSDAIKSARKKACLSQKQLAQKTGLSIATIQGYEQGKYYPKIENLTKIANALDVPLFDLAVTETKPFTITDLFAGVPSDLLQELSSEEKTLQAGITSAFHSLNISGKRNLCNYAQDLTEIEKYKKKEGKKKLKAVFRPAADPDQSTKK